MPIKGLTDRGLSFPEIGQIRKGAKKPTTGKPRPGKDLKHFRVEFAEGEEETDALFEKIYGTEPNNINIILPFNEIERCWGAWLEGYTAGRMVARADGEHIIYQVDTETGDIKVMNGKDVKTGAPVPYTEGMVVGKDYKGKPVTCKPVGRLRVFIPELARAAYMTVLTSSLHDIANLSDQLGALKQMNYGQIAGIPLVLRRRPKMISIPKADGSRMRVEKWMLSIEADPQWVRLKIAETKRLALPENGIDLQDPVLEGEVVNLPPGTLPENHTIAPGTEVIGAGEEFSKPPAVPPETPPKPPKPTKPRKPKPPYVHVEGLFKAIVEAGYAPDEKEAIAMIAHCTIDKLTLEEGVAWAKAYHGFRGMGGTIEQAAAAANEGEVPK